eukprot:gene7739-12209_t
MQQEEQKNGIHSNNQKKFQLMKQKLSQHKKVKKEKIPKFIDETAFSSEQKDTTPIINKLKTIPPKSITSTSSILSSKMNENKKRKFQTVMSPTNSRDTSSSQSNGSIIKRKKQVSRWNFLIDIKDANQNKIGSEDYDCKTLFIPSSEYSTLSSMEKQYWDIKRYHYDTIIFFKKASFYCLYEKDAEIGRNLFDLKMMEEVNMKYVGVPEISLKKWINKFLDKGYNCGVVEQMETRKDANYRLKDKEIEYNSKEYCVERELIRIYTPGTLDSDFIISNDLQYLLIFKEDQIEKRFGIIILDLSIGEFQIGEIEDDNHRTNFETLIQSLNPKEILIEKNNISKHTKSIIKTINTKLTFLISIIEFWDSKSTKDQLNLSKYFETKTNKNNDWPNIIKEYSNSDLCMSCLGACIFYLKQQNIDKEIFGKCNFKEYKMKDDNHLILDGQTIINLEIFRNNTDHSKKNSLISILDYTITPFGKRLFLNWISFPLKSISKIKERQKAIEDLNIENIENIEKSMKLIPDLERYLMKLNCLCEKKNNNTINYNEDERNIKLFINTINGLSEIIKIIKCLKKEEDIFKSKLIKNILNSNEFDEFNEIINYFEELFDHQDAIKNHFIIPKDDDSFIEYKNSKNHEKLINEEFEKYLNKIKNELKYASISYSNQMNSIEISNKFKEIPNYFQSISSLKNVNRYTTPELEKLVDERLRHQDLKIKILREITKNIFEKFINFNQIYLNQIKLLSELDCLISLTKISKHFESCIPNFYSSLESPNFIELKSNIHPFLKISKNQSSIIENDILIGKENAKSIIVSGANMAGKSTLLKQISLTIIMAQIGCPVPAGECNLTPIDKIFTRIGSLDRIMSGESTFMVELKETSNILKNSTPNSLVILDELGRGTSTFDGQNIAFSVLKYITEKIKCRCFFSTHYHTLTDELMNHPLIDSYHMKCLSDVEKDKLIFLYKFIKGRTDKSHGLQVAKMAGISDPLIKNAKKHADKFENEFSHKERKKFEMEKIMESAINLMNSSLTFNLKKDEIIKIQKEILGKFYTNWEEEI